MWLAIIILVPIFVVVHAHYFSHRVTKIGSQFGIQPNRFFRCVRVGHFALSYSFPLLIVGWVAYLLVVGPERRSPPTVLLLDYLVVIPFWVVTVYSAQCTLLIAPLDLIYWIAKKLRGTLVAHRWQKLRNIVVATILLAFSIYVPVRILIDEKTLTVRQFTVYSKVIPADLDEFRIALIADPQADQHTGAARIADLVRAVNDEGPDLVLIAGDIITNAPEFAAVAAAELGKLRATHGVVSCVGDHENFAFRDRKRSVRHVIDALSAVGIAMLDNEVHYPIAGNSSFAVLVATDNYITRATKKAAEQLMTESSSVPFRIVLAHQTGDTLLNAAKTAGVELFVSGHTHGGQVNFWFPFFQPIMARVETPYITGRYQLGDLLLIVSSGLGVSVFPFRYRAPATVDMITLRVARE